MSDLQPLVHHRSELGEWETYTRPPHPALRTTVGAYAGWMERTTFTRRVEVPSPLVVLIIPFPQPLHVAAPREPETRRYEAFVGGMVDAFVVTEAPGGLGGGIQVNFSPLGAYQLLGLPQHLIANQVIDAVELLGNPVRRLIDQLIDLPTWSERFDALDAFFLRRLAEANTPSRAIAWAWNQLVTSAGAAPIAPLRDEAGLTPRQFIDQFRHEIGFAPKTAARILRFNAAIERIENTIHVNWTQLAVDCGYYDQSHFVREFKEFSGSTPTDFLGRKLPDGAGFLA